MFLEKLIKKYLHRVTSLTMNELRRVCIELSAQDGNKDEMIKQASSVLLNEDIRVVDWMQMMLNAIKD